jgi:hypothetical protein
MKKMEETKNVEKKLSYEELEKAANELIMQNQQLYAELQKANMANVFKRLDYLFKVVEFNTVFDTEFVNNCTTEIKDMMTIKEDIPTKEN